MYHVSTLTILAIIFTMFVAIGGPVFLCFLVVKKFHAKLYPAVIGAAAFVFFVLVLESVMHRVVLGVTGDVITGNIWLYGLYGGLAAGLFEETGRYLAMRLYMKKSLTKENSLMYGVGHGGIEAVMLVGISYISNLMVALMINGNDFESLFAGLDDATTAVTIDRLSALWTLPSYQFFFAGVERISAMMLQIALSYLVYRAVKEKQMKFYGIAVGIHFAVDAATVILSGYLGSSFVGLLVLEGVLLAAVILICIKVSKLYRAEPETVQVDRRATAPLTAEREKQEVTVKKNTGIAQAANAVKRMSEETGTPEEADIVEEADTTEETETTETTTENETKDGE